jgi:hypothetical protein
MAQAARTGDAAAACGHFHSNHNEARTGCELRRKIAYWA